MLGEGTAHLILLSYFTGGFLDSIIFMEELYVLIRAGFMSLRVKWYIKGCVGGWFQIDVQVQFTLLVTSVKKIEEN